MATNLPVSLRRKVYSRDNDFPITIAELVHCVQNQDNQEYRIGRTTITPRFAYIGDKNCAKIVNSANPHGFWLYGNGDVRIPSDIDDILPSLPIVEQDKWVIKTFGVFR